MYIFQHINNYKKKGIKAAVVLELVDSLDLKSSGIYSRGGSSPPEATTFY